MFGSKGGGVAVSLNWNHLPRVDEAEDGLSPLRHGHLAGLGSESVSTVLNREVRSFPVKGDPATCQPPLFPSTRSLHV